MLTLTRTYCLVIASLLLTACGGGGGGGSDSSSSSVSSSSLSSSSSSSTAAAIALMGVNNLSPDNNLVTNSLGSDDLPPGNSDVLALEDRPNSL